MSHARHPLRSGPAAVSATAERGRAKAKALSLEFDSWRDRNWHALTHRAFAVALVIMAVATMVTDSFGSGPVLMLAAAEAFVLVGWWVMRLAQVTDRRSSLLLWPLTGLTLLLAFHYVAPAAAALLVGFTVLMFLFIGLSQRPGRSVWLLAPSVAVYLIITDPGWEEGVIRVPILVLVWLVAAEMPARLLDEVGRERAQLDYLARHDPLTGLLNRSGLDRRLGEASGGSAIALIDLDEFKAYNDQHGHPAGDEVLIDFAAALSDIIREEDAVFRYGGEEFLVVLADARPRDAAQVLERLKERWSRHPSGSTFSAGIVTNGPGAIVAADQLLYLAKSQGRNRIVLPDSGMA